MKKIFLSFFLILTSFIYSQTVGLLQHDSGSEDDGYVLFAPLASITTYLIDKCGRQVKTWNSTYIPGSSVYLLSDGTLLRAGNSNSPIFTAGGTGGIVEKFDWDGNLIWSYSISDATKCQHHDVKALPNGNVLVIAWDSKTESQAIEAGRNPLFVPQNLWCEQILEIQPVGATGGNVVWEWHIWDHLVQDFDSTKSNFNSVTDNPQLLNINYNASTQSDWLHLNSIDYNPDLDQILLSSFSLGEIWIIDHSTTTSEAAGHTGGNSGKGGDLLYRYGNPATYNNATSNTVLFNGQHNAHWITQDLPFANQIMVHNNGNGRVGGNYSTVEIINPPVNGYNYDTTLPYLPHSSTWTYNSGNPNNYYAPFVSSAQQLSNGNVLICNGPAGIFFEVDTTGNTHWKYVNPVNDLGVIQQDVYPIQIQTFRCTFYPSDYSGFAGHSLIPGNIIENSNPISATCNLNLAASNYDYEQNLIVYPNPAKDILNINLNPQIESGDLSLINSLGQTVFLKTITSNILSLNTNQFSTGIYYLKINSGTNQFVKKIMVAK